MNPLIPIALLFAGGVYAARGVLTKNAAEKLTFEFNKLYVAQLGLLKTTLSLWLDINNPTDTPLRIQNYNLKLYYNNNPVADIVISDSKKNIAPNQVSTLTIPIILDNVSAGKEIYLTLVKQKPLKKAVLKGTITINDFTTTINEEIPINII